EIATRYGFWQFGRLVIEYKALFGKAPLYACAPAVEEWSATPVRLTPFASQAAGLAYLAARGRQLPGSRSHPVVDRRTAGRGDSPSHVYRQPGLAARCPLARP